MPMLKPNQHLKKKHKAITRDLANLQKDKLHLMALNLLLNQTKNLERSNYGKLSIEKRSGVSVCFLGLMRNCFKMGELIVWMEILCHSEGMGLWEGELFFLNELVFSDSLCFVGNNGFAVVWFLSGTTGNWKASKQTSSSSPGTMSCLESRHNT